MAYQNEREERIRQSHKHSLLWAATASSERRKANGMDVVNTKQRSPSRTVRIRTTADDSSTSRVTGRSMDQLRLSFAGSCPLTPIITSLAIPPERANILLRSSSHQDTRSSSSSTLAPSVGSTALSSNINMQRNVTFRPEVGNRDPSLLEGRADFEPIAVCFSSFQNEKNNGSSSGSEEHVMKSEDTIEFPLRRRHRREAGNVDAPMDATSSPLVGLSLDQNRDTTPTSDVFNTTSTFRATLSDPRLFGSSALVGTFYGSTSWTSSELPSQSSTASTSSKTGPSPISQEMISQVNLVVIQAEKAQKRVCRYLLSSCRKSGMGEEALSSAASSDGESGLDELRMSVDEPDNVEDQLSAAKKQVSELKDQLERLRESRQCKICKEAELTVILLPCNHMATCVTCTLALAICPICHTDIKHVIKPNIVA